MRGPLEFVHSSGASESDQRKPPMTSGKTLVKNPKPITAGRPEEEYSLSRATEISVSDKRHDQLLCIKKLCGVKCHSIDYVPDETLPLDPGDSVNFRSRRLGSLRLGN